MPTYRVTLGYHVTDTVTVDADNPEAAVEAALAEGPDMPNSTNKFEASGDPEAFVVYDADGETVWEQDGH